MHQHSANRKHFSDAFHRRCYHLVPLPTACTPCARLTNGATPGCCASRARAPARDLINSARNDIFANLNLVRTMENCSLPSARDSSNIRSDIFWLPGGHECASCGSPASFCHDLALNIVALTSDPINWIYQALTHHCQEKNGIHL